MTQPPQQQSPPGTESRLEPKADHGETSYRGSGRLEGKATLITGADSGIGRAVSIAFAAEAFGRLDVLVNNAAFQMTHDSLEEIPDEEWGHTFQTNVSAMFHLCKAAVGHMESGASIINSSSVNSDQPKPQLLA